MGKKYKWRVLGDGEVSAAAGKPLLLVEKAGLIAYDAAMALQERIFQQRLRGLRPDTLLVVEHPHVFTLGRAADDSYIHSRVGPEGESVPVRRANRGGQVTYHGPGQVVLYPIVNLRRLGVGVARYVWLLEETVITALMDFGVEAHRKLGFRGVWVGERKIASIGVAVSRGISSHGLAVNVNPDLRYFRCMDPCGLAHVEMTSLQRELGREVKPAMAEGALTASFTRVMDYRLSGSPPWIKLRVPHAVQPYRTGSVLDSLGLHSVCREACCPNLEECWSHGTATFLLLGRVCTRRCGFCAVDHGAGLEPDPGEPARVAEAAVRLGLRHLVLTSVDRDDLADGGAFQFAAAARAIRERLPEATVEVLVPDFQGSKRALELVLDSPITVFGHNLETVPRLYGEVRPGSRYRRSLGLLEAAAKSSRGLVVKSGLMVGLGEREGEILQVMRDLRSAGCHTVTIGQYLRPSPRNRPVKRYAGLEEFARLKEEGLAMGFQHVEAGPLVRSSYRAWSQVPRRTGQGLRALR